MIHEPSSFLKRGNKLQSIRMRHVTTRLDSQGVASRANRPPAWRIDNRGNDSCRFDPIDSNRQHFQPTLHSPPEVKVREIMIHEPYQRRIDSSWVYWTTLRNHQTLTKLFTHRGHWINFGQECYLFDHFESVPSCHEDLSKTATRVLRVWQHTAHGSTN